MSALKNCWQQHKDVGAIVEIGARTCVAFTDRQSTQLKTLTSFSDAPPPPNPVSLHAFKMPLELNSKPTYLTVSEKNEALPTQSAFQLHHGLLPATRGHNSPPPSACNRLIEDSVVLNSPQECSKKPPIESSHSLESSVIERHSHSLSHSLTLPHSHVSQCQHSPGLSGSINEPACCRSCRRCLTDLTLPPAEAEFHQLPAMTLS